MSDNVYCEIIDGEPTNFSSEVKEGMVKIVFRHPQKEELLTKRQIGYKWTVLKGKVYGTPVLIDRTVDEIASMARKLAEAEATVSFMGMEIDANDKAVSMLQAYIMSSIESVSWKCIDGFVTLDKIMMSELLGLILDKKAELFENERLASV